MVGFRRDEADAWCWLLPLLLVLCSLGIDAMQCNAMHRVASQLSDWLVLCRQQRFASLNRAQSFYCSCDGSRGRISTAILFSSPLHWLHPGLDPWFIVEAGRVSSRARAPRTVLYCAVHTAMHAHAIRLHTASTRGERARGCPCRSQLSLPSLLPKCDRSCAVLCLQTCLT